MKRILFSLILVLVAGGLKAENNFINILELGAKNDGSEDISAIVNSYTDKGGIFLPAGLYRVDAPLRLKHPLRGEGYSRTSVPDASKTWLISNIECADCTAGVIEYEKVGGINVENLNVKCHSNEDGIRIMDCAQLTMSMISHVGIFGVGNCCGIRIEGGGSRPVFMEDLTIFGKGPASESTGILVEPNDCRLSNIEIMGTQIGLVIKAGYTYGSNLHLWTGVMGNDADGKWWPGTRGIVLYGGGIFTGSQIYPDTSYIVFEQKDGNNGGFDISEILYYDDRSERNSRDKGGMLFYAEPGATPNLNIHGGVFAVCGTDGDPCWMSQLYTPGQNIDDVMIRTDRSMSGENINVLCIGDALPDYTLEYADKGWCKVADIFDMARTGYVAAELSADDGASWGVEVLKEEKTGIRVKFKARNSRCRNYKLIHKEENGIVKIFVLSQDGADMKLRFTTESMGPYFRPADYRNLRAHDFSMRYREVLAY